MTTAKKPANRKPANKPMKMSERKPAAKKPVKKAAPKRGAARKPAKKANANVNPAVHTVPHDKGWANKRAGANKVSKVYRTKAEAQRAGRLTAMRDKVEHIIHTADGKIGERNSYGNDPRSSKG
jgi:hypothetical protein